jgi:peptidoglycan hydrolase-like protein with peptidoglycan-binding domain
MTATKTAKKRHFEFQALQSGAKPLLKYGDSGDDVRALQAYLTEAGYLRRDRVPGRLCDWTSAALRHFQKCYGLPDTGEADEDTLRLITRPRCGVPDIGPDPTRNSGPAPFVLRGCKYTSTDLTYAFFNGTSDLADGRDRELVRHAFAAWEAVSPLRFIEVAPTAAPTFSIAWAQLNHGDGSAFDDGGSIQGNVLAHAFFPPPCGGPFAGALHFDEFELWTDAAAPQAIRLLNVAIHEIGHLLGLDHSNNPEAIMFAFYDDAVDRLQPDDIDGIQALYGRPAGVLPIRGELQHSGDSQVHRVTVPAGRMTVTLRGAEGQDFDLYVRAGLPPSRTAFDGRSFTASSNEEVRLQVSGGEMFILVDSWRGSGNYELQIISERP